MNTSVVEIDGDMLELNMTCWNKVTEISMVMSCLLDQTESVLKESAKYPLHSPDAVNMAAMIREQMRKPLDAMRIMVCECCETCDRGFDLADEMSLENGALQAAARGV